MLWRGCRARWHEAAASLGREPFFAGRASADCQCDRCSRENVWRWLSQGRRPPAGHTHMRWGVGKGALCRVLEGGRRGAPACC